MTRKTRIVTIDGDEDNRDAGKIFVLTEMGAMQAEKWGIRALQALGTSGVTVPQEMADAGIFGVALIGYQAFMKAEFTAIEPLLDEMMGCFQYRPSEAILMPFAQWGISSVEEVSTLRVLRGAWLELHTGFTLAELAQQLRELVSARTALNLSTTSASRESAEA